MSKITLLEKIEACRAEMISLYYTEPLTSDTMISASKKLDELINQYQTYDQFDVHSV